MVLGPDDRLMLGNEVSREFVVAVLALVRKPLLQSGCQSRAVAALGLSQSMCGLPQLVRMGNLLATGEGQQGMKTRINADLTIGTVRNSLRLCVDEETQIPARGAFDDAPTFEASCREGLRMKPHMTYPWDVDMCACGICERIRERNARQLVTPPFEPGLLRQCLIAALPGNPGSIQHPLQGMTWNAQLFAMISQEIMEGFLAVIDTIIGVCFDLAYSPIPDPCQMPEPRIKLVRLRVVETELELSLDHATPVSGFQCTA